MSDLMRKFLTAYIEWVDAGAPDNEPFERSFGLCSNTDGYAKSLAELEKLDAEICAMFEADGLSTAYPFGFDAYNDAASRHTQHLHKPRIDWVRSKLAA